MHYDHMIVPENENGPWRSINEYHKNRKDHDVKAHKKKTKVIACQGKYCF